MIAHPKSDTTAPRDLRYERPERDANRSLCEFGTGTRNGWRRPARSACATTSSALPSSRDTCPSPRPKAASNSASCSPSRPRRTRARRGRPRRSTPRASTTSGSRALPQPTPSSPPTKRRQRPARAPKTHTPSFSFSLSLPPPAHRLLLLCGCARRRQQWFDVCFANEPAVREAPKWGELESHFRVDEDKSGGGGKC